ncbi:2'-5' RNA ligase family protein [Methylobacter psychrophilus]|uniref:2'-5' RNA ligase family protein n=1 Tax=Methylobacter psychrophilus TaxID=96941 RepID=UPI0021D4C9C1|nr:2'-5' RNA ligase family protein [Methylobacter psychrophilus]
MNDHTDTRISFLESGHTIPNIRRDFREWHLGRSRYAFWAIDLDCSIVCRQVTAAEQHLADFLLDGYDRKPHITLSICGFLIDQPKYTDDFGTSHFAAHLSALHKVQLQPFQIEIGSLASFSSAPFFHVNDPSNSLYTLRNCLTSTGQQNHQGANNYIPHVTVGLYGASWPTKVVNDRLDKFPQAEVSRCLIKHISLMSYSAFDIGGPLTIIADYHFDGARIHWHETPLFDPLKTKS